MIAKGFKKRYFSLAAIAATVSMVQLQAVASSVQHNEVQVQRYVASEEESEELELEAITVEAEGIRSSELRATANYEVYTAKDIKASQAIDLIEFLNRYTSINVASSFGNRFSPRIDVHGYGLESGYENIVVSVDGRRLNNIDLMPQLLASIPVESIEKIEILKGSGAVLYGDGATAAVINIITKPLKGVHYRVFKGNYKTSGLKLGGGLLGERFYATYLLDLYRSKGFRQIRDDIPSIRHKNLSNFIKAVFFPTDTVEYGFEANFAKTDNYYANPITKEQFDQDPKQEGPVGWNGKTYDHQILHDSAVRGYVRYEIAPDISVKVDLSKSDKKSSFPLSFYDARYDYLQYDLRLDAQRNGWHVHAGATTFAGKRRTYDTMRKSNYGYFVNLEKILGAHRLNIGARLERVKYKYISASKRLQSSDKQNALTLGYNYALSDTNALFVNFTKAYQFPDVDRFFTFDFATSQYVFNDFIDTMKTKTYTIGFNHITKNEKLKIALYQANVTDEIYLNPSTYQNTILDKTRKRGVDLEYRRKIGVHLATSLHYAYVATKIKSDVQQAFVGKKIPSVSKHNLTVGIDMQWERLHANITHTYRSSAYALSDFQNDFRYRQKPYNSTDVGIGYNLGKNMRLFAKVTNLFGYKNMVVVRNDYKNNVIYPENAVRTYYIGIEGSF